ncbi:MAG: hypothetical protein K5891_08450 [Lachnospiraceae bacterium]|nr:hypothetical protein [Lachnospiraceae bacterium]
MHRILTQPEIDTLVDVLNTLKEYGNTDYVSDDILKSQIVLTQPEIDKLIDTLNNAGLAPVSRSDHNVVLSQEEIDRLVSALNDLKEYDSLASFLADLDNTQAVLTQEEIDKLLAALLSIKDE